MVDEGHIICGDAKEALGAMPPESVDLTVTSPPYFRHRDYGVSGQLGREATVDGYVKNLRGVLEALLRVTTGTGSCFFVVGDTYEKQKLLLVPHRLALAANEIGWFVRNDLIWSKLDPLPESPRNRWRCGHEHVLFLTKRPASTRSTRTPLGCLMPTPQRGDGATAKFTEGQRARNGRTARLRVCATARHSR